MILFILLQTILVGTVTDRTTGDPIPNANIYFSGTNEGTTSDNDGAFYLRADLDRKRTLVVSAIGYRPERFAVEPNRTGGIEVALREQTHTLQEVIVTPGANPALAIVDSVRKHKGDRQQATGDRKQATGAAASSLEAERLKGAAASSLEAERLKGAAASSLEAERLKGGEAERQQATGDRQQATGAAASSLEMETVKLSLSNFTAKQLQRRLWKQFEPMMVDSMVTLYWRQTGGEADGLKGGEVIEKAYILTATDYRALIPDNSRLNFYQNDVSIANKAFLSPLASSGRSYYDYYLIEEGEAERQRGAAASSLEAERQRGREADGQRDGEVRIDFRTKNPFYPTLNGTMWIDTTLWAITRLEATIPRNNAVNYLTGGRIKQSYVNGQLTDEYVATIMDFAIKQDSSHIWPSVLAEHIFKFNVESLKLKEVNKLDSLTAQQSYSDSGLSAEGGQQPPLPPSLRFASWLGKIIGTGYIPTGTAIDFGHIQEILQVNQTEGVHVGIPLRTNERLWKNISLEAAVGYGFKNRQFTGLGKVSFNLPTLRRNILSVEYRDHYVWQEVDDFTVLMRENGVGYGTMDFTSYAFEALRSNKQAVNSMIRKRQFQITTENDWSEHVETNLYLRIGQIGAAASSLEAIGSPTPLLLYSSTPYSYSCIGGIVRLSWGERKVDSYFRRVHVYGNLPIVYVGAEMGSWQAERLIGAAASSLEAEGHMYGKFTLMVRQTINLGMGGELDYVAQVGTMVGQVPFAFLHHFEGNQGYAYDPYRFTLMNNLQYNAKHFCALHLSWNGQGVLFNLIPGIRYLRLRELATFKLAANLEGGEATGDRLLAIGAAASSLEAIESPAPLLHHPSTPYIEIGCGIGNILRVLDLHSVWRLTNREDLTTPRWAMRFRIHLGL